MNRRTRTLKKNKITIILSSFLCCLNIFGIGFASWQMGSLEIPKWESDTVIADSVYLESVTNMIKSAEISSDIKYFYYENLDTYGVYNSTFRLKLKLDFSEESFLNTLPYDDDIYDKLTFDIDLYYLSGEDISAPLISAVMYTDNSTTFFDLDNSDNTFSIPIKSKSEKSIYMIAQNDVYNLNNSNFSYVYIDFTIASLNTMIASKSIYSSVNIGYTIKEGGTNQ